jgi:hypothetical protein
MPPGTDAEDASLIDLNRRSIGEAKNGMRSATGPHLFSRFERVAGREPAIACIGNSIGRAVDRLHVGLDPRRDLPIGPIDEERADE